MPRGQDALPGYAADGLVACRACDCVHHIVDVPPKGKALCRRCGAILYRNLPKSLDHSPALYLAAMVLFLLANTFPFVALQYGDRIEQSRLITGGLALLHADMLEIGILVLLIIPAFVFAGDYDGLVQRIMMGMIFLWIEVLGIRFLYSCSRLEA